MCWFMPGILVVVVIGGELRGKVHLKFHCVAVEVLECMVKYYEQIHVAV